MTLAAGHSQALAGDLPEPAAAPVSGVASACGPGEPVTEDSLHWPTQVLIQAQFLLVQHEQDVPHQQLKSLIDDLNLLANSPDRQCDLQIAIEAHPGPAVTAAAVRQGPAAAAADLTCA